MAKDRKQQLLDQRYLKMADIWAQNSYCKRRKVGALLVKGKMIISDGYNGTPAVSKMYVKMKTTKQNHMFCTPKPMQLPK